MARAALYLDTRNIPELIEYGRNIVNRMTGSSAFATPDPSLSAVTTSINELESAFTSALSGDRIKKAAQSLKLKAVRAILTQLGAYVQYESKGDKAIILSAGIEIAKEKSPVGILPAPQNLRVIDEGNEGSLELRWKKVNKAAGYLLQISSDVNDPEKWTFLASITQTKYTALNLTSGEIRYFRVVTTSSAGQGNYSEVIRRRVP